MDKIEPRRPWALPETFDFEGRSVRYGACGNGPPVVVVHGTPWSSYNLRHLIVPLSDRFTVYFHDMVGYGLSDKAPGDVSLGIQNRLLCRLIDHWGLERPAAVGHDFGGATVLRAHLLDERDFDRIVLIDPVAVSPWGSPFFRHVREHEAAFAGVPAYIHEAIVRAYVKTAAFRPLDPAVLDHIVHPWTGPEGQAAFYRQIAQAHSDFTDEVQPQYGRICRRVMILWGREDEWVPIDRGARLHDMISGSRFHAIPQAGHLVIEERPDLLLGLIRPFLETGGE